MDGVKRCIWCRWSRRVTYCEALVCAHTESQQYTKEGQPFYVAEDDSCNYYEREPGADDE